MLTSRNSDITTRRRRAPHRTIAAALVLALAGTTAAACGGSDSASGDGKSGSKTLVLGVAPVISLLLPMATIDKGLDKANGFTLKPKDITTTSDEIPQVLNGAIQIGQGDVNGVMSAISSGVPIKIIGGIGTTAPSDPAKATNSIVTGDPSIKTLTDLRGKKIAVNNTANVASLSTLATLDAAGVKQTEVTLVQVPIASTLSQLKKQQIPAGLAVEPFGTMAKAMGLRVVAPVDMALPAGSAEAVYFVSADWASKNMATIKKFQTAIKETTDAAVKDPSLLRKVLREHTKTEPNLVDKVTLPTFSAEISDDAVLKLAVVMQKFGYIKEAPKDTSFIVRP